MAVAVQRQLEHQKLRIVHWDELWGGRRYVCEWVYVSDVGRSDGMGLMRSVIRTEEHSYRPYVHSLIDSNMI